MDSTVYNATRFQDELESALEACLVPPLSRAAWSHVSQESYRCGLASHESLDVSREAKYIHRDLPGHGVSDT